MNDVVPQREGGKAPEFWERHGASLAFLCQIILLAVAGWQNQSQLNTDGIAYLRIAGYYANLQTDLMVSGYWGPLLSWLMVPWLKLGCDPLIAGRIAMALSALVFSFGCHRLFQKFEIRAGWRVIGLWVVVALSVFWSVRHITPDLLVGGLIALAVSGVMDRRWLEDSEVALQSGLLWAVAYLAKAVAFPLAFGVTLGLAWVNWRSGQSKRKLLSALAWTLLPFMVASLPWIITLSLKYKAPTFSTSGRINHAIAGPYDRERYHPFSRTVHQPDPGRVTSWEDPPPIKYTSWSPFENRLYALHQFRVILGNAPSIFKLLGGINPAAIVQRRGEFTPQDAIRILPGFDLLFFGVLGLLGCAIGWRNDVLANERWRWAIIPVICGTVIYLPVFLLADDQRYFYPLFPFVWIAACGAFDRMMAYGRRQGSKFEQWAARILVASFALPALLWLMAALVGIPNPAVNYARALTARMEAAKLSGPIAGSGMLPGGRAGLFTAYFMNQPWHGDTNPPRAERYRVSQAEFVIVPRLDGIAYDLERDSSFKSLDHKLFFSPKEAEEFPLKVFEVIARP